MDNLDMDEKEKEIAATNRLLNIIRGEKSHGREDLSGPSDAGADIESLQEEPVKKQKRDQKSEIEKERVREEGFTVKAPQETGKETSKTADSKMDEKARDKEPPETKARKETPKPHIFEHPPSDRTKKAPGRKEPSLLFPGKHLPIKKKGVWQRLMKKHEKRAIGLDIGSQSLKFVMLHKGIAGLRVLDYKIIELSGDLEAKEPSDAQKNLRALLGSIDLSNTRVVSSVSGPSVIVRHVQFPPMTQKELVQSLKWEAKSYIPFPMNEVNLDYQVIQGKDVSQKLDVILVAVTKKMLDSHLGLLKTMSIEPDIVDIDPLVLINTYMALHSEKDQGTVALIYIGAQSSVLSIYRPGSLFFTRDILIAGNTFSKRIQKELNISYQQAEAVKRGNIPDELSSLPPEDLQSLLKPVMNELINEIRRSLVYYDNQTGKKGFSHLVLTGGGSLLKGIPEFLSNELGLDVEFLDPFKRLHVDEAGHPGLLKKEAAERLSLSVGLALRGTI